MNSLALNPLDASSLITSFGTLGILAIIFAETGLMIGFFLPGDSLLFLAGVATTAAATKIVGAHLSLPVLMVCVPLCAIAGAQLGYYLGARFGPGLFDKPDSRLFKREYVDKAEHYFNKFGPAKAVVLARFIPIVRTFLNPVAGLLEMPARTFFVWNVVGAIIWTESVLLLGHFVGDRLKGSIDHYILPAVALIVVISLLPIVIEIVRSRRTSKSSAPGETTGTTSTSGRHAK